MAPRMVAALALLALVGLASTARLDGDQVLATSELAFAAVVLAVAAALVIGVGSFAVGGGYALFADNRRKVVAALVLTAVLALLLALLLAPADAPTDAVPNPVAGDESDGPEDFLRIGNAFGAIAAATIAAVALLAAALLVLGAVGLAQLRKRRQRAAPTEEEAVMSAVEESLDDLRRERDVRRAIIACYARMERSLERAGSGRRPAEAPFDYLVRILERITANGRAARTLTELFERAKFSVEPMVEADKQQAISALELLRAEVSSAT
jgi:Domain of unknown function (DUF4129)